MGGLAGLWSLAQDAAPAAVLPSAPPLSAFVAGAGIAASESSLATSAASGSSVGLSLGSAGISAGMAAAGLTTNKDKAESSYEKVPKADDRPSAGTGHQDSKGEKLLEAAKNGTIASAGPSQDGPEVPDILKSDTTWSGQGVQLANCVKSSLLDMRYCDSSSNVAGSKLTSTEIGLYECRQILGDLSQCFVYEGTHDKPVEIWWLSGCEQKSRNISCKWLSIRKAS